MATRAEGRESTLTAVVENRLRHDAARGIPGADEQHGDDTILHET